MGRKAPPPMREQFFWHQIYPFQAILSKLWFLWQKSPPPTQMREYFLTPDLSISGNFEQLWFWWQKTSPPPMRENFWHQIYPFQGILSNFGFGGRKAHPHPDEGIFFDTRSIHFRQFWATLVLVAEKTTPMRENFLTPDISISGNFEQLWFLWQKRHPQRGKHFWHQIYPFQAISSNFGFCGRKACPPLRWGKIFDTRSIHFRQFWATLVLVAEKITPMRENFLTPDISISGNFEQLWFWWQKRPPPPDEGKIFDTRSIHFRQFQATLVLVAEKPPTPHEGKFLDTRSIHFRQFWATLVLVAEKPTPMRENFLTPDLSISGNFEQLWFWWQKSPPRWGKIFWHQIYPFQAILSNFGFGGRKPPLPRWGKNFWHQIYPFQAILSNFGFGGRKAHPDEGKFFDTRSIHFRQFWATLVLVAEKPPPPPRWGENFLTPDLSISGNFEQLWFWWQKSPLPLPDEGKNFDTRYIHFRQFQATLVLVAEKITPMREKILTPDISISGNFEQLWFWWQKRPPPPDEGKIFDTRSIHFRQFQATLVLVAEKPPTPHEGKFLDTRSIHFRKFWATLVLVAENLPSPDEGKNFDTRSIHFRQFQATLILVAEKPTLMREIFFWHQIYPFQGILSNFGFGGRKAPPPSPRWGENFLTPDLSISGNFEQLWFWWQKSPLPLPDEGKIFDTRYIHFRQFQATLVLVAEKTTPAN